MRKMELGTYSFEVNPKTCTDPRSVPKIAYGETYNSVAEFSWPASLKGRVIDLEWEYMGIAQFDTLDNMYVSVAEFAWKPNSPSNVNLSYTVKILKLEGKLLEGSIFDAPLRSDVKLSLLILS